jgi:hypothetical protein
VQALLKDLNVTSPKFKSIVSCQAVSDSSNQVRTSSSGDKLDGKS